MSRRRHRDRGSALVEMPLAVCFLVLPAAGMMMLLPTWGEAQTAAQAAAKEAATVYATASDPATGCTAAQAAVARAAANSLHQLALNGGGECPGITGEWCRGCSITATVSVAVPVLFAPGIGSLGSFDRTATSTARIDDYRSLSPEAPP